MRPNVYAKLPIALMISPFDPPRPTGSFYFLNDMHVMNRKISYLFWIAVGVPQWGRRNSNSLKIGRSSSGRKDKDAGGKSLQDAVLFP